MGSAGSGSQVPSSPGVTVSCDLEAEPGLQKIGKKGRDPEREIAPSLCALYLVLCQIIFDAVIVVPIEVTSGDLQVIYTVSRFGFVQGRNRTTPNERFIRTDSAAAQLVRRSSSCGRRGL